MTVAINPSLAVAPVSEAQQTGCEIDDFTLLRRYAGFADSDAFAQIVQRYANFVYSTCLRVIGDRSRAEDLSQETFFRLMRRPHEVRQNLGGWLHRTATHLALDSLRSENSRRRREITYAVECDHEASSWAELSPSVDQALAEMPAEPRLLLISHFLMGKTQAQLAVEMGQSASTISRRMQSALEELRKHLRLKGVYALPAALGALMFHITARQAPASLLQELGKITMLSGASHLSAASHAAKFPSMRPSPRLRIGNFVQSGAMSTPLVLAALGMIFMLILLRLSGILQPTAAAPVDHDSRISLKTQAK